MDDVTAEQAVFLAKKCKDKILTDEEMDALSSIAEQWAQHLEIKANACSRSKPKPEKTTYDERCFCGSPATIRCTRPFLGGEAEEYAVECCVCSMRGPYNKNESDARRSWRKIVGAVRMQIALRNKDMARRGRELIDFVDTVMAYMQEDHNDLDHFDASL